MPTSAGIALDDNDLLSAHFAGRLTNMHRLIIALLTVCSLIGQEAAPAILPFGELPSRMIKPLGWTKTFLERQRSGLTGHPAEMGFPFNRGMWADELNWKEREYPKSGGDWWPYEQTAYYLDGALRCAYLLEDQAFLAIQRSVIADVLNHPKPDGRLGTRNVQNDGWPMVGFMRMLLEEYENTHDQRLLSAILRHYQLLYPDVDHMELKLSGFGERVILHVENLCRLALLTGDHSYGTTAARLYERYCEANPKSPLAHRNYRSGKMNPGGHAVSFHEFLKLPAVLHCVEPQAGDLDDTAHVFQLLADQHELADGLASAAEGLCGKRSDKVHETCNATDFIWSCGYMLEATGDGIYGDKMEKALFNAGFGSVLPDFKAHQYYSSPNQIILADGGNHWNSRWPFASGRLCYRPGHDTECCSGNIHRLLPIFLKRQWLCDPGSATITAALYAPCEATMPLPSGPVVIRQETSYPFEHAIDLVVSLASPQSFTLRLRIPAWSDSHQITVNGQAVEAQVQSGFASITRKFATDDRIRLKLATSPRMQIVDRTASISYGPLVFCLPIPAQTTLKTDLVKSSQAFPAYEFRPDGAWNYGLSRHLTAQNVNVIHAGDPTKYPWEAEGRPLRLRIPASVVGNWTLGDKPIVPDVPRVPEVTGPQTTIELVPIGGTTLRVAVFPLID